MCVFYLFADPDRTTGFSTFIFDDSVKLLRLFSIRLISTAHIATAHIGRHEHTIDGTLRSCLFRIKFHSRVSNVEKTPSG